MPKMNNSRKSRTPQKKLNVSPNVKRHAAHLYVLSCCSNLQRKGLIETASPKFLNAICECLQNSLYGRIPHHSKDLKKLANHKKNIKKIIDKKFSQKNKKKILIQSGSGFLSMILGPVVGLLSKLFTK